MAPARLLLFHLIGHRRSSIRIYGWHLGSSFGPALKPQWRGVIIGEANGERPALLSVAHTGYCERGRAAGGDRDNDIRSVDPMLPDQPGGLVDFVFSAFGRAQQRILAARYQKQQAIGRPVERRDELSTILDGEAAGRSRANVNQSASAREARLHRRCGVLYGR